jgi:putative chitinase
VNAAQLIALSPNLAPHTSAFLAAAANNGINTPLRQAHWLAQLAHESGGFKRLEENLNYSADALRRTWPGRFDEETAKEYARQPQRIANKVYADRLGNGNEKSGEGARYLGRGYIQLTGKANYAKYSNEVFGDERLVDSPELAAKPEMAAILAATYWRLNGLNALADKDDIVSITKRINGGLIGLESRKDWLRKAKDAL